MRRLGWGSRENGAAEEEPVHPKTTRLYDVDGIPFAMVEPKHKQESICLIQKRGHKKPRDQASYKLVRRTEVEVW